MVEARPPDSPLALLPRMGYVPAISRPVETG